MQWRTEFNTKADDLRLFEMDEGSGDLDVTVFCALSNERVEGIVVSGTAVRVSRAVLLHGADKDSAGAQDLGPADGGGEEVGVAEGHVGDGHLLTNTILWCGWNGDGCVGEC